jgi:UDP-glucose 4-epimerase
MPDTPQQRVDSGADDLRNQTVLVTGGAGFVGSHLAEALVADNDVRILDDFSTGRRENVPEGTTVVEGDIRDSETVREAVSGADVVFHQAGLVSVPASVEDPLASQSANVTGTLQILEAAREAGARVVVASSVAVYGDPVETPISEDDRKRPLSPYGVDKLAIDHYTRRYHDLYDMDTVALRYFNVYGPGQQAGDYSGVGSTFLEQAGSGQPLTVHGDGAQTRDFVHVSDVVRANLAAATTDAVGRAYNVGTGDSIEIRELAELVQSVTDTDAGIVHTEARTGDIERSEADASRARRDLDWTSTVDLADGLRGLAETAAPVK